MHRLFAPAAMTTSAFLSIGVGCSEDHSSLASSISRGSGTVYLIPLDYDPEPGLADRENSVLIIDAEEFSFFLTGRELQRSVPGFDADHLGLPQDTMVIVQNLSDEESRNWRASERLERNWDNLWRMQGSMSMACVDDEPDPLTGLFRYTTSCDPEPHPNSSFFLMDRRPTPDAPRPTDQSYVRATCQFDTNFRIPDEGRFYQCIHRRMTAWGDVYQFRTNGDNVRLMDDVETYIESLLDEWRLESRD